MRYQSQSKPTSSFSRNSALSVGLRSFDSSRNFRKCFPSEKNKQTTILLKLKNISNQHDNPHTLNQVHFTTNITLPSPANGSVNKKLSISCGGKWTWQKILEAHHDAKNLVDLWHSVPFWHTQLPSWCHGLGTKLGLNACTDLSHSVVCCVSGSDTHVLQYAAKQMVVWQYLCFAGPKNDCVTLVFVIMQTNGCLSHSVI